MKTLIQMILLSLALQSFQCSKSEDITINDITPEQLQIKKQEIITYINTFSCSETVGCSSIAFGSKPCGSPREYLLFSNSINRQQLQQMVTSYDELDNQYNNQINAISDCLAVQPPASVSCVNGVCTAIN